MARIRHIKPDFFVSDDVTALDFRTRLTWIGLWTHADDHGRLKDNARAVKGAVWSLDDSVGVKEVEADLAALARRGRIVRYQVDGQRYLAIVNWHRHQRPNRPSVSKIPPPTVLIGVPGPGQDGHCPACWTQEQLTVSSLNGHATLNVVDNSNQQVTALNSDSLMDHAALTEDSRQEGGGERGMEGGGETRASAPTPRQRPRCPRHAGLPHDDPGPNCRDCRDARLAEERNDAAIERAMRHAIRACRLCDGDGWRWINPQRRSLGVRSGPNARCDHQPTSVEVPP